MLHEFARLLESLSALPLRGNEHITVVSILTQIKKAMQPFGKLFVYYSGFYKFAVKIRNYPTMFGYFYLVHYYQDLKCIKHCVVSPVQAPSTMPGIQ